VIRPHPGRPVIFQRADIDLPDLREPVPFVSQTLFCFQDPVVIHLGIILDIVLFILKLLIQPADILFLKQDPGHIL
jgi:hypothetical protein